MPITTRCPACNKTINAPDGWDGYTVSCPKCSQSVHLPVASTSNMSRKPSEEEVIVRRVCAKPMSRLPIIAAVAVAILVICAGAGVVWLASRTKSKPDAVTELTNVGEPTRSQKTPDNTPAVQPPSTKQPSTHAPKDEPTPKPKSTVTEPAEPVKPKEQPPAKVDDRKWTIEAKREYLEALEEKESRMKAHARQVGNLDKTDYELAKQALRGIQKEGSIESHPAELVKLAEVLAPSYIAALRRELLMSSPDYPEMVRKGVVPRYHATEKRKELYAEFATAIGDKAAWSVSRPFAALSTKEMDALMEGVRLLKDGGLGRLTKAQRLLLLKAGALDYFEAQLKK